MVEGKGLIFKGCGELTEEGGGSKVEEGREESYILILGGCLDGEVFEGSRDESESQLLDPTDFSLEVGDLGEEL